MAANTEKMSVDKKRTGLQARGVDRPAKRAVMQEEAPSRCGSPGPTDAGKARPAAAAAGNVNSTQAPGKVSRDDRALAQWHALTPRFLLAWAWELALLVGVTVALLSQVSEHKVLARHATWSYAAESCRLGLVQG